MSCVAAAATVTYHYVVCRHHCHLPKVSVIYVCLNVCLLLLLLTACGVLCAQLC